MFEVLRKEYSVRIIIYIQLIIIWRLYGLNDIFICFSRIIYNNVLKYQIYKHFKRNVQNDVQMIVIEKLQLIKH